MEHIPRPKMTVTRFIFQILLASCLCLVGSAGLTPDGAGHGLLGNLVGLGFIFIGVVNIIDAFVSTYRQWTGEEKTYDE